MDHQMINNSNRSLVKLRISKILWEKEIHSLQSLHLLLKVASQGRHLF